MKKIYILVIILGVATGCSVGRKMSFSNEEVKPDYSKARSMAIAFQENRKEVLEGKEKPSFCGHMNSTAQIEYNMQTETGKPLAEEFSGSVTRSLVKLGIRAEQLVVGPGAVTDSVLLRFGQGDKERLLLFRINAWEASAAPRFSTIRYEVDYNLDLGVYDRSGTLLATSQTHDHVEKEETQMATSLKYLQRMADEVFVTQVKQMLNDPKVRAVLE